MARQRKGLQHIEKGKMQKEIQSEYDKFDQTMRHLVRVPHSEIKAKLDAEKAAKAKKRKPKTSASRASGGASRDSGD
jgi:hypothetical protein